MPYRQEQAFLSIFRCLSDDDRAWIVSYAERRAATYAASRPQLRLVAGGRPMVDQAYLMPRHVEDA